MTRASRALVSALTLTVTLALSMAGCKDPTLVVGELQDRELPDDSDMGETDLPDATVSDDDGDNDAAEEPDSAVLDAGQDARADAGENAGREGGANREPRDPPSLPRNCRRCDRVRDAVLELCPPFSRTFEFGDCFECGCCESDQTCMERDPNLFCAGRDSIRDTVGLCWPRMRPGGGGFPLPNP